MIQEFERTAAVVGLHPQAHLAQLHRHRVDVDPIQTTTHHLAQRLSQLRRGGLDAAAAHPGQPSGDAVSGRHQEMARPAGRVQHPQVEQGLLGMVRGFGPIEDRVERVVQNLIDQGGGGVVAAGGLAFATSGRRQTEPATLQVYLGVKLQQRLINRTQLGRAQVAIVHQAMHSGLVVLYQGQVADHLEEVPVIYRGVGQVGDRFG